MVTQGIVYIAVGQQAFDMATASARSILNTSSQPQSITAICDKYYLCDKSEISIITVDNFSLTNFKDAGCFVAYLKTRLHQLSPYHKTLYLDNDIRAVKDISSIWEYVDRGIGLSPAFNPLLEGDKYDLDSEELYTVNNIHDWHQYNTGMLLFTKSELMSVFFEDWTREWEIFKRHENMALTRLLDCSDVQPIELFCKFNDFYPNKNEKSILVHYISWYKKYLTS
jgi:Glycosyl transferase family 8